MVHSSYNKNTICLFVRWTPAKMSCSSAAFPIPYCPRKRRRSASHSATLQIKTKSSSILNSQCTIIAFAQWLSPLPSSPQTSSPGNPYTLSLSKIRKQNNNWKLNIRRLIFIPSFSYIFSQTKQKLTFTLIHYMIYILISLINRLAGFSKP